MNKAKTMWSQWWFPSPPAITEKDIPDLSGKVLIVTGATSGVGLSLTEFLYASGAKIYLTSRSTGRIEECIQQIKSAGNQPKRPATLVPLALDLNDLESVKKAAATFQNQETKLDILWNNAGTGGLLVQEGEKTAQGFEPMIGRHCIATLLFTELLLPQLRAAAATSRPGSVRVTWTSSIAAENQTPPKGIIFENLKEGTARFDNYGVSKLGSWMLAVHLARLYAQDGICFVPLNPGNIKAGSYGGMPAFANSMMMKMLHDTKFGAYTNLFAGLSAEITMKESGSYVIPWGKVQAPKDSNRPDLYEVMKEDGDNYPKRLYKWCKDEMKPFV